jgi:CBS domain-containing protein
MSTLRDLCQREVFFVRAGQTVLEAARYMAERNVGAVAVLDQDRLAGIFSERDVLNRVVARGRDASTTLLREVMTSNPVVVDISSTIGDCLQVMRQAGCRHLPVVDRGRFAGMVSLRDALQVDLEETRDEIRMMRAYIHGTSG